MTHMLRPPRDDTVDTPITVGAFRHEQATPSARRVRHEPVAEGEAGAASDIPPGGVVSAGPPIGFAGVAGVAGVAGARVVVPVVAPGIGISGAGVVAGVSGVMGGIAGACVGAAGAFCIGGGVVVPDWANANGAAVVMNRAVAIARDLRMGCPPEARTAPSVRQRPGTHAVARVSAAGSKLSDTRLVPAGADHRLNPIRTAPSATISAPAQRRVVTASFNTTAATAAPNTTLVSRSAVT